MCDHDMAPENHAMSGDCLSTLLVNSSIAEVAYIRRLEDGNHMIDDRVLLLQSGE